VKITENEKGLLIAIVTSEYGDWATDDVWVNCLWGWSETRKFPGVMASLVRKGLAKSDGECCCLTDAGAEIALALAGDKARPLDPKSRVTPDDAAVHAEVAADLAASKDVADDLASGEG
jgi:hypothetical protein